MNGKRLVENPLTRKFSIIISNFLDHSSKVFAAQSRFRIVLLILSLSFLALIVRWLARDFVSDDMRGFLFPWYDSVSSRGCLETIKQRVSNYTPLYLYLLSLAALLPTSKIIAIKLISVVFDFILAGTVFHILKIRYHQSVVPWVGYFLILFSPLVIMNSALWGQVDAGYTSFLLLALLRFLETRMLSCILFFALALSFKAQAIFLLPWVFTLLVTRKIPLWSIFVIPATYLALILPPYFTGASIIDLVLLYPAQHDKYTELTLYAPNLYQWCNDAFADIAYWLGIASLIIGTLGLGYWAHKHKKKLNSEIYLVIALLSSLVVPFILPRMHERYFFVAAALSIIYSLWFPRRWYVALIVVTCAYLACASYLHGVTLVPIKYLALGMGSMIISVGKHLKKLVAGELQLPSYPGSLLPNIVQDTQDRPEIC